MIYKDDDKFLVTRDRPSGYESFTITAIEIKNLVNPTGKVDDIKILDPIPGQGTPIQLDIIDLVKDLGGGVVELTLKGVQNLDLVNVGDGLTQSDGYTPKTKAVSSIDDTTPGQYILSFQAVNYDFKYFEVGDEVFLSKLGTEGTISGINEDYQTITVSSSSIQWGTCFGQYVNAKKTISGSGDFVSYTLNGQRPVVTINNSQGTWVQGTPYNNQGESFRVNTVYPIGGSAIDTADHEFVASEFGSTDPVDGNSYLYLTKVIWILNGQQYVQRITDAEGLQKWNPGFGKIIPGKNTIQVKYEAGLNFNYSPVTTFIASDTPFSSISGEIRASDINLLLSRTINLGL